MPPGEEGNGRRCRKTESGNAGLWVGSHRKRNPFIFDHLLDDRRTVLLGHDFLTGFHGRSPVRFTGEIVAFPCFLSAVGTLPPQVAVLQCSKYVEINPPARKVKPFLSDTFVIAAGFL